MQAIFDNIKSGGPQEHMWIAMKALKLLEYGYESFKQAHPGGVIGFYEQTVEELGPVAGGEVLWALLKSTLTAEYDKAGRLETAIAAARSALPVLAEDGRLPYAYAQCLHDLGVALYQSGKDAEGIEQIKLAAAVYDTLPDRDRGEVCRENLARLSSTDARQRGKGSLWSRLFGGGR